jgi:hypothetical protein
MSRVWLHFSGGPYINPIFCHQIRSTVFLWPLATWAFAFDRCGWHSAPLRLQASRQAQREWNVRPSFAASLQPFGPPRQHLALATITRHFSLLRKANDRRFLHSPSLLQPLCLTPTQVYSLLFFPLRESRERDNAWQVAMRSEVCSVRGQVKEISFSLQQRAREE